MKKSRYTTMCHIGDEYVLYNFATGRLAVCDTAHAKAFEACVAGENGDGIAPSDTPIADADALADTPAAPANPPIADAAPAIAPSAALSALYDAGFLVDDDLDELSLQREKFRAAREDRDQLWIAIAPTYACNCRCAYCYEQDKMTAKSRMSAEVERAIYAFVAERFAASGFTRLFVEWYGGDPQLCLDTVERISEHLIDFCDERAVDYNAMMLSNSTRIGEDEADLLLRCRISSMLITIDGPEDLHNKRRPAIDIANPYRAILSAISTMKERGIAISVAMNADRVNMARLDELRAEMAALDVPVMPTKLNNYSRTFNCPGERRFCAPDFDLYTHEEFAHANYEALSSDGFTAPQLAGMLAPCDHFCSGQVEAAYVIDAFGDVYKCDGWMGDKSRSLFNLVDWAAALERDDDAQRADGPQQEGHSQSADNPHPASASARAVHDAITFDPFEDEACRACELLPVCWGNCSWERELCGWPCHPLSYTLDRYLASYRACFPPRTSPFEVLA